MSPKTVGRVQEKANTPMLGKKFLLLAAGLFAVTAQAEPPGVTLYDENARHARGLRIDTPLLSQNETRHNRKSLGNGLKITLLPLFGSRQSTHDFTTAIAPLAASPTLAPSLFSHGIQTPPSVARGSHFDRLPQHDRSNVGLGGLYQHGGLTLGLSWRQYSEPFGVFDTPGNRLDQEEWFMGGRYDFGPASLSASWQEFHADAIGGMQWKDHVWQVSGQMPITRSGSLLAGYAQLGGENHDEASMWTLAYTHDMSSRTTAYAGYRQFHNGDFAGTGVLPTARFNEHSDKSGQGLVLGVRHAF
ncbi:MAG TPA: porin [Azoarcus sp.]|nr:porin [Azoarcus sp.]